MDQAAHDTRPFDVDFADLAQLERRIYRAFDACELADIRRDALIEAWGLAMGEPEPVGVWRSRWTANGACPPRRG